jgi:hypothetical protein
MRKKRRRTWKLKKRRRRRRRKRRKRKLSFIVALYIFEAISKGRGEDFTNKTFRAMIRMVFSTRKSQSRRIRPCSWSKQINSVLHPAAASEGKTFKSLKYIHLEYIVK